LAGLASLCCTVGDAASHTCTCRAHGKDYEQGQIACIRGQLARCDMNLNNSSWKIISDVCPEVLAIPQVSIADAGLRIISRPAEPGSK
jgi:hypothetical protein